MGRFLRCTNTVLSVPCDFYYSLVVKQTRHCNISVHQNRKEKWSTLCLKNVPPLICYNFDITVCECILIFFSRNVTDNVSNQKTLYSATPNNLCFCTTWQNGEIRKSHFFTQMLYQCIARIQLVPPWFLQSFWLTTHTQAAVWLPKSCNQCAQLGAVGRHGSGEKKSTALQQLDSVACTPMCCLPERKKCHLWCVW